MTHTLTFFNIRNADCIRLELSNGKMLLFDYAHMGDPGDPDDLRCNLPKEIRSGLGKRTAFDVVAFTHLDRDHYAGATDIFYFDHIKKYQGDVDGEARIHIETMWVPSAVITEPLPADADSEKMAIQREARERFKAGKRIRVFSRPERLREWCERNDIELDDRKALITDAGNPIPGFTTVEDGVEFFVHSPFGKRQDEDTVEDRNNDALVLHATLTADGTPTRLFLASDIGHEILTDIVEITEFKEREERLNWDIFKLPHHCSHHSLRYLFTDDLRLSR